VPGVGGLNWFADGGAGAAPPRRAGLNWKLAERRVVLPRKHCSWEKKDMAAWAELASWRSEGDSRPAWESSVAGERLAATQPGGLEWSVDGRFTYFLFVNRSFVE